MTQHLSRVHYTECSKRHTFSGFNDCLYIVDVSNVTMFNSAR